MTTSLEPRNWSPNRSMDKATFSAGLRTLKEKSPNHPLLPSIEKGYNAVSVKYLISALDTLDVPKAPKKRLSKDKMLSRMRSDLNKLFVKRAKLSNSFHDCIDDQSRAAVSQQIGYIQADIRKSIKRIDYYKKNKRMPVDKKLEEFPIPEDGYKLALFYRNKKSSLHRSRRNMEKNKKQGLEPTPRQIKSLNRLIDYVDAIQRAIAEKGL